MGILTKMNAYETDMGQGLGTAGAHVPGRTLVRARAQGPGRTLVRARAQGPGRTLAQGQGPGTGPDPDPIFLCLRNWSIEFVFFQK